MKPSRRPLETSLRSIKGFLMKLIQAPRTASKLC